MPFSFTFKLAVPGLSNPFQQTAYSAPNLSTNPAHAISPSPNLPVRAKRDNASPLSHWELDSRDGISRSRLTSPSSATLTALPLSRKRGWVPSSPEPSQSMPTIASTSGYLDTPAKYREMAEAEREAEFNGELPPTKRRKTLAGSIVSTALSAALIGTAVGLTVYRLWRDRGKDPEQITSPPPPYQQGEWRPIEPAQKPQKQIVHVTPPTPQKRRTPVRHTASIRKPAQRTHRARLNQFSAQRGISPLDHSNQQSAYQPPAEFDVRKPHEDEVEDQMDWIGDKLSMLIEEGKRALGKEVVVMSDAREDEVDDGSGCWEEIENSPQKFAVSASRQSSMRRSAKRPRAIATSNFPPSSSPASASWHHEHCSPVGSSRRAGSSPPLDGAITPRRGSVVDRERDFAVGSFKEDQRSWDSPELKELMERARARFNRNRTPVEQVSE